MPQITEEILDSVQLVDVGSPVPQITEEVLDSDVGSLVPQITEEILDSVRLVDVGSVVPLITEDGADVVQVMPQDRVQNRTQQQIVGVLVRDKNAIWEKIVEETQLVLSKRKQERNTLREHTWCKDFRDVPVLSRPDHPGDALIPHVTEFADEVRDVPLQRIWCIIEEDGSASVEQIVDVPVPQDMETIGCVQENEELRGWNKESRLAALSRLIADTEALLLSGRLNGIVHEARVRYSIVGRRREIESLHSFCPLDQRCFVETMLAELEEDSDFS